ncbi:hypothetical protein Tco_1563908 [Tanacetum coccineum]
MYPAPHLSQPQISHSSVPPSHEYQSHINHQTSSVPQKAYHSPQVSTQPITEFPQLDSAVVQGRQGKSYASTGYKVNATSCGGNNIGGQARVEKAMLAEAQESGQILDEEQLAFADPGIPDSQAS